MVSGRLSVRFPMQQPHKGPDRTQELLKFMCLGSDVGGINRRPLKVIFSLETAQAAVLGRKVFYVRICSCHKRDKASEEERMQNLKLKANHTTLPRTHLQHLGTTPSLQCLVGQSLQ